MPYGKFKTGKAKPRPLPTPPGYIPGSGSGRPKPRPIGIDELRNRGKMGGNVVTPPGKPGKDNGKPKYGGGKVSSNQKTGPKVGLKEKLGGKGGLLGRGAYLEGQAKKRQQKNRTLARPVPPMKGK